MYQKGYYSLKRYYMPYNVIQIYAKITSYDQRGRIHFRQMQYIHVHNCPGRNVSLHWFNVARIVLVRTGFGTVSLVTRSYYCSLMFVLLFLLFSSIKWMFQISEFLLLVFITII